MSERQPDWDIDYAAGRQAELFVADLRQALVDGRCEVKLDRRVAETGNIYVEGECKYPRRGWVKTGIANPDTAPFWVYVLGDTGMALVFTREALRQAVRDPQTAWTSECRVGGHPTKGWLIRLRSLFYPFKRPR